MKETSYGLELILDIINCNNNIKSEKKIKNYINKLCKIIEMKRYGECVVQHFGHNNNKTSGYSAVQLIETSSIICHFSENYRTAHINIFSCKDFDDVKASEFTINFFGGEIATHTVLERIMGKI